MEDKLKTVEDIEVEDTQDTEVYIQEADFIDPILKQQQEDVSKMRTSLLSCNGDPANFRQAISNITVLRIYHQLTRIIRYTELMDKLEEKVYDSLSRTIDNADPNSSGTWLMLMEVQEKLQKMMISSHKLLQPYLDIGDYNVSAMIASTDTSATNIPLDSTTRDALRANAQAVLALLDGNSDG